MSKRLILFSLVSCVLIPSYVFSQSYFQQEVNYEIHVSLDDVKHELSGSEKIEYINHSPDTLTEIYVHLWPNGYKNDETAFAQEMYNEGSFTFLSAKPEDRGYIDSLNFYVNDIKVEWGYDIKHIDICVITLNEPLLPSKKVTITTPFHVKIPSSHLSRLGHLDQAYFITQWYPKPAVYDQYGWHAFPYMDQGEYYSEFGTFDVYITLPENYIVGATGELQDESELKWLEEKVKTTAEIKSFSTDMSFTPSSKQNKTLHYKQDKVHDFAWFADKRYHVLKGSIELPDRNVTSWVMFTNNQADWWKRGLEYLEDATMYYSKWVGEYPYNTITAVDGTTARGVGMEYPTITLIGEASTETELEMTIVHEVGHNWFYGIVGSNEREHPWMDEGINNFYETRYGYTKYADQQDKIRNQLPGFGIIGKALGLDKLTYKEMQRLSYLLGARLNMDQSQDTAVSYISPRNYAEDVYYKTSVCFDYLKSYLGDSLFDKCMNEYFRQWKFRHPYPNDLKKVFETVSAQNLDWFFNDLLRSNKKADYAICSLTHLAIPINKTDSTNGYLLKLKNRGEVQGPFSVSTMRNGKVQRANWEDGFESNKEILATCDSCDAIKIDALGAMPELNMRNNFIRTSGMLKKFDPVKLKFFNAGESTRHTFIYFTPTIGRNLYDKWMMGMAFYNLSFVPKRFEYVLNPMFSFGAKEMVGGGMLSYSFFPQSNFIRHLNLSSHFSSYHYNKYLTDENHTSYLRFSKLNNSLRIAVRKQPTNYAREYLTLNSTLINTDEISFVASGGNLLNGAGEYKAAVNSVQRVYNSFSWTFEKQKAINPYFFRTSFSLNTGFMRGDMEGNYFISYGKPRQGFEVRAFAGMVGDDQTIISTTPVDYRLKMSGWSGSDDYVFSEVFIGRSEQDGFWSHQFVIRDGGFKVPTASGISSTWLAALNFTTSLPGALPIRLFADIGFYDNKDYPEEYKALPMFDYGVEVDIVKDIFVVYLPIGWSDDIQYFYDQNTAFEKYSSKIRFEFNLTKLNPVDLIRKIEL